MSEPTSELPRRRLVVEIKIGADTWDDVVSSLMQLTEWAVRRTEGVDGPAVIDMCSGGPGAGYIVTGSLDPKVTHDSYFAALEARKAAERP